jgi:hypothetical protein
MSCGHKNSNSSADSKKNDKDSIAKTSNLTDSKIEFKKYIADGMFLKGKIRLFDNNLKITGKLEIDKITLVEILAKSTKMYNVEEQTDNCEKAYFLKVKYLGKEYIVFGQDVYEISNKQKFSTLDEKKEKLILFPVTNFEMGASDEKGLTACDEYSILVLHNKTKNHYSLIRFPENDDIHTGDFTPKYAVLFNDDMAGEKIYKFSMRQDTLVIGIKATYQEGGSVFNLKTKLSTDFPKSEVSDRIRFDTDEELKKMEEIK